MVDELILDDPEEGICNTGIKMGAAVLFDVFNGFLL